MRYFAKIMHYFLPAVLWKKPVWPQKNISISDPRLTAYPIKPATAMMRNSIVHRYITIHGDGNRFYPLIFFRRCVSWHHKSFLVFPNSFQHINTFSFDEYESLSKGVAAVEIIRANSIYRRNRVRIGWLFWAFLEQQIVFCRIAFWVSCKFTTKYRM